jgi:uncharacterized protein (TIGR02266 family)
MFGRNSLISKKILLVDDVELFLEMEKDFFRRENFTLLVARSGREALEVMQRESPDLVFMDLYMPEGNGDDICRQIKENPETRGIPVVIVTNSRDEVDFARCRQAGCEELLMKPVARAPFLAAAYRILKVSDTDTLRIHTRLPVRYGIGGAEPTSGYTFDLSTGGLFIETDKPHLTDTVLHLEINLLQPGTVLHCQGRVAWANHADWVRKGDLPSGMAIQFLALSPATRDTLRAFVARKKSFSAATPL